MNLVRQYAGQGLFYALLIAVLGFLTVGPRLEITPAEHTRMKIMVRHSGVLIGACTELSAEAFRNLPANMQRPLSCPRQKAKMKVQVFLDDNLVIDEVVVPSGIHDDGVLAYYQTLEVRAGPRQLRVTATSETDAGPLVLTFDDEVEIDANRVLVLQLNDEGINIQGTRT